MADELDKINEIFRLHEEIVNEAAKEEAEKHTEQLLTPEMLDMISGLADKWGREVKVDQGFLSLCSQAGQDDHANDQEDRRYQTKTAEDDHNQRKNICRNEYTHEEHSHLFRGKIGEQKGPGR